MTEFRDQIGFGGEPRAAYASDPARSRGLSAGSGGPRGLGAWELWTVTRRRV